MQIRKMCAEDIPLMMQADGDMSDEFLEYLKTQRTNQDEKMECTALVAVSNEK